MASLFPKVRRLLYLDNDVVVSCCLEEIYYSAELNKVTTHTLPLNYTFSTPTTHKDTQTHKYTFPTPS